jgi:hypothetical protein
MPISAIIMLVVTALILFGGIIFCIIRIKVGKEQPSDDRSESSGGSA